MGGLEALTTGKIRRGNGTVSKSPYRRGLSEEQSLSKSVGNWRKLTKKFIAWGGIEDARIGMFRLTPCDF